MVVANAFDSEVLQCLPTKTSLASDGAISLLGNTDEQMVAGKMGSAPPGAENLVRIRIGGPTALRPAVPLSVELSRLAHEPAPQVDDLDAVPVGCLVTGFGDDSLGIRVANFPQGRNLSFEGAFL